MILSPAVIFGRLPPSMRVGRIDIIVMSLIGFVFFIFRYFNIDARLFLLIRRRFLLLFGIMTQAHDKNIE
jgi:hypothetical protein